MIGNALVGNALFGGGMRMYDEPLALIDLLDTINAGVEQATAKDLTATEDWMDALIVGIARGYIEVGHLGGCYVHEPRDINSDGTARDGSRRFIADKSMSWSAPMGPQYKPLPLIIQAELERTDDKDALRFRLTAQGYATLAMGRLRAKAAKAKTEDANGGGRGPQPVNRIKG